MVAKRFVEEAVVEKKLVEVELAVREQINLEEMELHHHLDPLLLLAAEEEVLAM